MLTLSPCAGQHTHALRGLAPHLHFALDARGRRPADLVNAAHCKALDPLASCEALQLPHQDVLSIRTLLQAP